MIIYKISDISNLKINIEHGFSLLLHSIFRFLRLFSALISHFACVWCLLFPWNAIHDIELKIPLRTRYLIPCMIFIPLMLPVITVKPGSLMFHAWQVRLKTMDMDMNDVCACCFCASFENQYLFFIEENRITFFTCADSFPAVEGGEKEDNDSSMKYAWHIPKRTATVIQPYIIIMKVYIPTII